jgi:cytochrome c553
MARRSLLLAALLAAALAAPSSAQDLERGGKLYALCTQCHGAAGAGSPAALAPAIGGLPQWYVESQLVKFRAGHRGGHFDDIAGMRMRPMALTLKTDADVAAVAAYVASLPPVDAPASLSGADPAKGQLLFAPCAACHGADGTGNPALFGPPLANASDWYLVTQLANFKTGVRGAKPEDQTGTMMRAMAMTLPDEQAMRDVVAYITTLSK